MSTTYGATTNDIVKGALRRITSYQSGESIAGPDFNDCIETFNDLFASLSTDDNSVPGVVEYVVNWTAGKNTYNVGNPLCTELGFQPFTATLVGGSNQMTIVGAVPANLLVGATLTDSQGLIPAGITNSTNTVATGLPPVISTNYLPGQTMPPSTTVVSVVGSVVTMSQNAIANSQGNALVTYSVPGDFLPAFRRPLILKFGFTRFNNLDFPLDIDESLNEYGSILYKPQPGPWPTVAFYNNTYPYGVFKVYQTPGNNAELHLFAKVMLNDLSANQPILLPPGYVRALKWMLARELWVEYWAGVPVPPMIEKLAMESLKMVQDLNAKPAQRSKYDRALVRGNRADGGWIFYGGYR